MCHILNAQEAQKILLWNNQLAEKKAKTRVQVVATQKFVQCAHCGRTVCTAFTLSTTMESPSLAKKAAIHTPYILALQIVSGPNSRYSMRIVLLTTPVPARAFNKLPLLHHTDLVGCPCWRHAYPKCATMGCTRLVPTLGRRECKHLCGTSYSNL